MDSQYVVKQISPDVEGAGTIALILEIIFGFFGLLGIGHVYTNRIAVGIVLMVVWWVFLGIAAGISSATLGIGLCLFVPIYLVVPIISGIQARTYARRQGEVGNWGSVAMVAGGGCLLLVIGSIALSFLFFGGLAALSSFQ